MTTLIEFSEDQAKAITKILNTKRLLLIAGLGFGKTLIALYACRLLQKQNPNIKVAIVTLKSHINLTWIPENEKYNIIPHINNVDFISIDLIKRIKTPPHYDFIILDECTQIKNSNSKRFKIINKLCLKAEYVLFLTATPISKSLSGIWAITKALLGALSPIEQEYKKFLFKYFDEKIFYVKSHPIIKHEPKKEAANKIADLLKPYSYIINKKEKNTPLKNIIISVKPTEDFVRVYKKIIDKKSIQGLKPAEAAIRCNRLHQLVGGCIYKDDFVIPYEGLFTVKTAKDKKTNRETILQNTLKLDAITSIVQNEKSQIAIVFYYIHHLALLKEKFPEGKRLTKESLKEWNSGNQKILFLHSSADSHSFNLQKGGHVLIWFHIPWSPTDYMQMVGRFHRRGQKNIVKNYILLIDNTIDHHVYDRLIVEKKQILDFNELLSL